jgi:hypothetical protein
MLVPVLTADSLWHLPKASNKLDVDLSRMLVDLGHEELHDQVEIIQD